MSEWKGGLETKPDWDTFYMSLAYLTAQRSIDVNTVHGACLVSSDNRLLSVGYNGPIRNSSPNDEDLSVRPNKYWMVIHAEDNCIMNYHGSYSDLTGSTIYITGEPCHRCLRTILQKGIRKIVYGHVGSKCVDKEDIEAKEKIIDSLNYPIEIVKYDKIEQINSLLNKTLDYIKHKE